jgi:hypothetical protein
MDRIVMALAFPFCGANAQAPVSYWNSLEAFGTPMEPQAGLQTAEAALAAINAGAVTRAPYYRYGLLTKFLRGPAHTG